ncbi:ICE2 family ER membrane protein [Schizosaccharomyces japonicus yFS275]|uniref:ICE2 family ER membrane protein n=1 Tax=Schizosaccharomyces japonicus (strain yFS275 / FY16936) TaxID=402676 RepID=B6K0W5_SCHJY|nr:ICE2 family ER membrane protein [Schizosaccharomyces japonicus yFS275]EEB07586.1 ICE2 family ER membrane protein [Schizosaccharomyces japonicus yFS275]
MAQRTNGVGREQHSYPSRSGTASLQNCWPSYPLRSAMTSKDTGNACSAVGPRDPEASAARPRRLKQVSAAAGNLLSLLFFLKMIVLVGLGFDVGGMFCGLFLTLLLELLFLFVAVLKWTGCRRTALALHVMEPLLLAVLLIVVLAAAPVLQETWLARLVDAWKSTLLQLTPLFTLLEGLASLLVIQALGELGRWLVYHRSENWMFFILINASVTISTSLYLLYRVSSFDISTGNAVMIGISLATAVAVSVYGIGSGRASVTETSLIFSYIAYCVYMVCTDFGSPRAQSVQKPEFSALPPDVLQSIHSIFATITRMLPQTLYNVLVFLFAVAQTVSPSVFAVFAYRIAVLYSVTRILPAIQQNILFVEYSRTKRQGLWTIVSPCILIAVYTNLLLQHLYPSPAYNPSSLRSLLYSAQIWRWVGAMSTLVLYAIELAYNKDTSTGQALASHFKLD